MSRDKIASLLQKATGLDERSIGPGAIRYAIQKRLEQSAAIDEASYLKLLQSSQAEMTALIEEVVVPETWFFRQEEAFRLMQMHFTGEWQRRHAGQSPRLLSVPSSSGEEAYSMAMTLLDAGFKNDGFHIDAIDISEQILNKAKRAVFGKGSFRSEHLGFQQRYFRKTEQGQALHSSVRQPVHFHYGNILDHDQMRKFGTYDVIFCRNLLIYFNEKDRKRTVVLLAEMLREGGLLFIGHAETGLIWKELFASVVHPYAFAFRRLDSDERAFCSVKAKPRAIVANKNHRPLPSRLPINPKPVRPMVPVPVPTESVPEMDSKNVPNLECASRLADQGRLEEARLECDEYLKENSNSAQAWFLLGLISNNQGHEDLAKEHFRKALYLEPDHYESLVHLMLLLDQLGDQRAAQCLRERVQRVSSRQAAKGNRL